MSTIEEKADKMVFRMYQMYQPLPDYAPEDSFEMYAYDRILGRFWQGFVKELYNKGLNDKQVEWLLRSKNMRWMFDREEDEVLNFGKKLASTIDLKYTGVYEES